MKNTNEITSGEFKIVLEVEVRLEESEIVPGINRLMLLRRKAKALEMEIAESDFNNGFIWCSYKPKLISTDNYY